MPLLAVLAYEAVAMSLFRRVGLGMNGSMETYP